MDEREIVKVLKQQRLEHARPWEPVSSDYLTVREFLSLIGIGAKGKEYRQSLLYLELASRRDGTDQFLPAYLKKCFRDGVFRVHAFRSRNERLVGVEYRIPVESLDERYAGRIKEILACRNGKTPDAISRTTLRKLRQLSEISHRSVEEILNSWVNREMDAVLGKETKPPCGTAQ